MAGFGKFTLVGEFFSQKIINVLWYRSANWLPLEGNPFAETQAALDTVVVNLKTLWLNCFTADYTFLRGEGVGFDDALNIVTPSPVFHSVGETGTRGGTSAATSGAVLTATIQLQCGAAHQITGVGATLRNRGYLAIGPIGEQDIDNYGHIDSAFSADNLEALADALTGELPDFLEATSLIPIRMHKTTLLHIVTGRSYSDVLGYRVSRRFGKRWSRMAEE